MSSEKLKAFFFFFPPPSAQQAIDLFLSCYFQQGTLNQMISSLVLLVKFNEVQVRKGRREYSVLFHVAKSTVYVSTCMHTTWIPKLSQARYHLWYALLKPELLGSYHTYPSFSPNARPGPAGDTRYSSTSVMADALWLQMLSAPGREECDTRVSVTHGVFPIRSGIYLAFV